MNQAYKFYITIFFIGLILGGFSESSQAQYFWNTNFEYEVYKSQPRKWTIEGEGENYNAYIDSKESKSGDKSLFMSLASAETYTILTIPGELVSEKKISTRGYIKAQDSDSLQTQLIAFNPAEGTTIASAETDLKAGQWKITALEASVPENYDSDLLIALVASGSGSFWFDDVQIKIDGKVFGNAAPDFRKPDEREITLLNKKAFPFETGKKDGLSDLNVLSEIAGNARLVALGENSHGSSSIYRLKLRMLKYLVEQEQFSVFALEMPTVEAAYINKYVENGRGNIDEILEKLTYPSWQTQEMIDIIEWIREYNGRHKQKVEFTGFDMQNGWSALGAVKDFAASYDSVLSNELEVIGKLYEKALETGNPEGDLIEKAGDVVTYLNIKGYPEISQRRLATIRHYAEVFVQSLSFHFRTENAKSRDEYMAENIRWILEHTPDTSKIIISGDNTHITRAGGKMGTFLSRWYKEDYVSFGITYRTGTYSAYGPEPFYEVHPPYVGTYEYYFSKSRYKNFILDLRQVKEIPLLNQRAGFRSIGSRPQETTQFYEIDITKHFDAIVYLETSKHTSPLKK